MKSAGTFLSFLFVGCLILLGLGPVYGAESDSVVGSEVEQQRKPLEEALEGVRSKLQEVEAKEDLESEQKETLIKSYRSAEGFYQLAIKNGEQEAAFKASIESAPEETAHLEGQLTLLGDTVLTNAVMQNLPEPRSIENLEQHLTSVQADLVSKNSRLTSLEELIEQNKARSDAIRDQQAAVTTALSEIEEALSNSSTEGDLFQPAVASATVLVARKAARQAERAMLDQELLSLPLRAAKTEAEKQLIDRQIAHARARVAIVDEIVVSERRALAEAQKLQGQEATRQAKDKHELLKVLAAEFAGATQDHAALQQRIDEELKSELDRIQSQADKIEESFKKAREQIELVGLSDSLAVLLLDQWRRLPNLRTNRTSLKTRKAEIGRVGLRRFQIEEALADLPDQGNTEAIRPWVEAHYPDASKGAEEEGIWDEVAEMIRLKRSISSDLVTDYNRLLDTLGDIDLAENKHISIVEEYTHFLEERLLWIPSASPIRVGTLSEVSRSIAWLCSKENRAEMLRAAQDLPNERPVFVGFLGMLLLMSVGSRPLVRKKEQEYLMGVKRVSTDSFSMTLRAALMLLLQSAPFAVVLALVGRHLVERETEVEVLRGFGVSLLYAAIYLFGILVLLNVCRPKGLGQAHFRWSPDFAGVVRRELFWFLPVVLLTTIAVDLSEELSHEFHRTGLGRLALLVLLVAGALLISRTVGLTVDESSIPVSRHSRSRIFRSQRFWFWTLLMIPVGLALLSALGYHHTAVQLTRRAAITVSFLVGAFVVHQMIWRWFVAKERKFQLEKLLEQRRATAEKRDAEDVTDGQTLPEINEDELDLQTLNEQTRRLLRSLMTFSLLLGVWLIWSDVLPALNALDSVKLWDSEVVVDGVEQIQPVTLNHLALSLIVIVIITVAVRNISGVLEIGILQNLPLAAGSRYAIVTVVQYGIVMFGAVLVFNVLGFSLAQFGWMMAALSVGLGFGLQEVVANFVSGVILLAERPIRVGDIVTVSDVSGIVTRIRIRATTITNWDRQELVVPNKEFITGRILNWTLSNTVNRIVITVGVAYGSDTDQARKLLLDVAKSHPLIMDEPGPMATFEGFDDSTLRLILRCYLPNLDNRLSVVTELHTAIDRAFIDAGIEISFPQQDIHVRTVSPQLFQGPSSEPSGVKE